MNPIFQGLLEFLFLSMGVGLLILLFLYLNEKATIRIMATAIDDALYCSSHQAVQGGILKSYFDSDIYLGQPDNVGIVLSWFKERIREHQKSMGKIDRLVFLDNEDGPVGTLTLKDLLSWETKIPSAVLRRGRKGGATLRIKLHKDELSLKPEIGYRATEKPFVNNGRKDHVIIINSVITTGTTVLSAIDLVENEGGGKVEAVFVLYSRAEKYMTGSGKELTGEDKIQQERSIPVVAMIRAEKLVETTRHVDRLKKKASKKGITLDDAPKTPGVPSATDR